MIIEIKAVSKENYNEKKNEIVHELRKLMNEISFPSFKLTFKLIPVDGYDRRGILNMWV